MRKGMTPHESNVRQPVVVRFTPWPRDLRPPHNNDLIHLRQGEIDGACGPYCAVMTLITLGVMSREQALSLDTFDGRTRLGRFRDNLMAFGALVTERTDDFDESWLVELFKRAGVVNDVLDVAPRRKTT